MVFGLCGTPRRILTSGVGSRRSVLWGALYPMQIALHLNFLPWFVGRLPDLRIAKTSTNTRKKASSGHLGRTPTNIQTEGRFSMASKKSLHDGFFIALLFSIYDPLKISQRTKRPTHPRSDSAQPYCAPYAHFLLSPSSQPDVLRVVKIKPNQNAKMQRLARMH